MLHDEIGRLPERYRTPVVLCYLEGLTHAEAARQLGWPIGTVGVRLMRARERLRSRLTRRGMAPIMTTLLPQSATSRALGPSSTTQTARAAASFASRTAASCRSDPIPCRRHLPSTFSRTLAIKKIANCHGGDSCLRPDRGGLRRVRLPAPLSGRDRRSRRHRSRRQAPDKAAVKSILTNGGFERGDADGPSPDGWNRGAELAGVEYLWDRTVAHGGRASLHSEKDRPTLFPDRPVVPRGQTTRAPLRASRSAPSSRPRR